MTDSRDDGVNRINSIRAELEAQRERIFDHCQLGKVQLSGISGNGLDRNPSRESDEFPRSLIMRKLVEHPDWVVLVACLLMPRLRAWRSLRTRGTLKILSAVATAIRRQPPHDNNPRGGSLVSSDT